MQLKYIGMYHNPQLRTAANTNRNTRIQRSVISRRSLLSHQHFQNAEWEINQVLTGHFPALIIKNQLVHTRHLKLVSQDTPLLKYIPTSVSEICCNRNGLHGASDSVMGAECKVTLRRPRQSGLGRSYDFPCVSFSHPLFILLPVLSRS